MSSAVETPGGATRRAPVSGAPRSWIAEIAAEPLREPPRGFPVRRELLGAEVGGRGLVLYAVSPADLPEVAVDGRGAAVFEGRLDRREELRGELGVDLFRGAADAELALAAVRRWGEQAAVRLHGIYALIVWEASPGRLVAIRDRLGSYPLFFADAGATTVFATSPGLVASHPGVPGDLHREALAEVLCFRFHDVRETFYRHIYRIPAGWSLGRSEGGERFSRYWDLRFGDWLDWRKDDVPGRFEEIFAGAVGRCLDGGQPALFLSGGLDSVAVALEASGQQRERGLPAPLALSLAFPDDVDEVAIQRGVAERLGLEQVLLPFWDAAGHERTLLRVAEMSAGWPAPMLNLWRPSYLALGACAVERGASAILTGHGGDEWMDSGIDFASDLIAQGNLVELYRLFRMARRSYPVPLRQLLRNVLWRWGLRPLLVEAALALPGGAIDRVVARRKSRFIEDLTPDFAAPDPELRRRLDERAEAMLPPPKGRSRYRGGVPALIDNALIATLHEDNFEASRRTGLPMRMPFFDADVVELACRIRPQDLYSDGRSKGLLRSRVAPALPRLGFDRQKKLPATSFMQRIVREQTLMAWRETGGTPALAELGIVDLPRLERRIGQLVADELPRAYNLGVFSLSLETWTRARQGGPPQGGGGIDVR